METCPKCHLADDVSRVGETLTCARCDEKMPGEELVWISGGGRVYHRAEVCGALLEGQAKVERRGGKCASVLRRTRAWAQTIGRTPCCRCTPRDWRA